MVAIIHGEDIVASRLILDKFKKGVALFFDGRSLTLEKIKQEVEGGGLFAEEKTIILENFLSSGDREVLIYLSRATLPFDLIFWEDRNLDSRILAKFPQAQVLHFKLRRIIFTFLDSLRPGNQKTTLDLFHQALKTSEPEVIFYLLVRHFRLMLAVSEKEKIEEVKRLAGWQTEKLKRQANLIGDNRLLSLYPKLFKIELGQKTGQSAFSLTAALDLFLFSL